MLLILLIGVGFGGCDNSLELTDENIKLLLKNPMALADHSDINKEIDKWLEIKDSNYSKLQHLVSYLPKEEKKDGS